MVATVDGVNILSTYGLRLSNIEGWMDQPPFKKVLEEHDWPEAIRVLGEWDMRLTFIGNYADEITLGSNITGFEAKIASATVLQWSISMGTSSILKDCVIKDGITVNIYANHFAEVIFILTVTNES